MHGLDPEKPQRVVSGPFSLAMTIGANGTSYGNFSFQAVTAAFHYRAQWDATAPP